MFFSPTASGDFEYSEKKKLGKFGKVLYEFFIYFNVASYQLFRNKKKITAKLSGNYNF